MTDPSKRVARLLEAARTQHGPTADDRARVLAALHSTLGAQAPASETTVTKHEPATAPSAASAPLGATKILWVASVLAGVAALGVFLASNRHAPAAPVPAPERLRAADSSVAEDLPTRPAERQDQNEPRVAQNIQPAERPARHAPPRRSHALGSGQAQPAQSDVDLQAAPAARVDGSVRVGADGRQPGPANTAASPTLPSSTGNARPSEQPRADSAAAQRELSLISAALRALKEDRPTAALPLLEQHAAEYTNGLFRSERLGLRVLALCASGHLSEGRVAQASYLREFAATPAAARVRAACKGQP